MKQFRRISSIRPGRSVFDLSHEKKLTCDMGQLIPIMCEEMIPGDVFSIGHEIVARFQPLVAPILHPVKIYIHLFFVANRLMDDNWEEFITGGQDGQDVSTCPIWIPTNVAAYSLWDYLGFPVDYDPPTDTNVDLPLDYPRRAYNMIFNNYYRDQDLQTEVALTNEAILLRNWAKDYFTSARPFQQRGTAPAFPVTGMSQAIWDTDPMIDYPPVNAASQGAMQQNTTANTPYDATTKATLEAGHIPVAELNDNEVDLTGLSTFDVSDMRLAFAIQKWQERNARGGVRYVEFLGSHFGVNPRDDRLQRPEYIGGIKVPLVVSEVLQTSQTATTPQGTLAGHGLAADRKFAGKYRAQEFGWVMGIMSIMPANGYSATGFDRQFLRQTRYDYPFPEFANLSEQAIELMELCAVSDPVPVGRTNREIWGYQGRFDELRVKHNKAVAGMRDTFSYWHILRDLDPTAPPELNDDFIQCVPDKRVFAVQDEPGLIVSVGNLIKAVRPIPAASNPGLIDH